MFDLIMRDPLALDRQVQDEEQVGQATRHLLLISLLGLLTHGLVLGGCAIFLDFPLRVVLDVTVTITGSFLVALAVCLPSFYFYTQLSGLDASFKLVTAEALRVQATTSVYLLGVQPFFAAVAFASALGMLEHDSLLGFGLTLPFFVGLTGVRALYTSLVRLSGSLPHTHERRGGYLGRLALCWAGVYLAVAPIAMWRIGEALGLDVLSYVF